MLPFFPTPYPEELWYSVLCRYHLRTGNKKTSTTMKELFGKANASMNIFFANAGFYGVIDALPEGLFDREELYDRHTLTPYVLRFSPDLRRTKTHQHIVCGAEEKEYAGSLKQWTPQDGAYLCFCPLCAKCDLQTYGETYWHTPHQIQAMPLCPIHKCRLERADGAEVRTLRQKFYPASSIPNLKTVADCNVSEQEVKLSDMLYAFWHTPLVNDMASLPDSLFHLLQNKGYFSFGGYQVEWKPLLKELESYWGETFHQLIDPNTFGINLYHITRTGRYCRPELYGLLAVFLSLTPEQMLNPMTIPDEIKSRMERLCKERERWDKGKAAEALGIPTRFLEIVVRQRNMKPFWNDQQQKLPVRIYLEKGDKERAKQRMAKLRMGSLGEYVSYCMRREWGSSKG